MTALLLAALDEAEATLDRVESGTMPAVVQMARMRLVLEVAGHASMAVQAGGVFTANAPVVPLMLDEVCREAADVLDDAVGAKLATRREVKADSPSTRPEAIAAELAAELIDSEIGEQMMIRVAALIIRTTDVLVGIAENESALPGLREAAADAVDLLADLDSEL